VSLAKNLRAFRGVWAAAAAIVAIGPFAVWKLEFMPPWPPSSPGLLVASAYLACMLAVIVASQVADKTPENLKIRLGIGVLLVAGFLLMLYLYLNARFVVSIQTIGGAGPEFRRYIIGTRLYPGRDPLLDPATLIQTYGYGRVYEPASLILPRMALVGTFIGSFVSTYFGVVLVAVGSSRR